MGQIDALTRLHRRWWLAVGLFALVLAIGYTWLRAAWSPVDAGRWLVIAAAALAYELWLVWRNLPHNHPPNETVLYPTLGAGNILTLLRGLALSLLAGFLLAPWPPLAWLPAVLYTLTVVADGFDGYLARVTGHATKLGEILDMEFDALGVLVATVLAVQYGQLPWWVLSAGLARYLFVLGLWQRTRRGLPVYDLPPSPTRRLLAGFYMGFGTVMLWPIVYPPGTTLAGVVIAVPFLVGFTRDWLVVSGQLDPASPLYLAVRRVMAQILSRRLPPVWRLLSLILTVRLLIMAFTPPTNPIALFNWLPLPWPTLAAGLMIGLAVSGGLFVTLGLVGRLAALATITAITANIMVTGLHFDNGLLLTANMLLMLFGTGPFSLWQPEARFLSRRPGES